MEQETPDSCILDHMLIRDERRQGMSIVDLEVDEEGSTYRSSAIPSGRLDPGCTVKRLR